jgi:predicted Zn-dependent peptidase
MAQAQVLIETGGADFSEALVPGSQLFNDYFSGGMAGIVFQELRETRALAYSVNAVYRLGTRPKDQNITTGDIGCQADKTPEALGAFLKLFNDLPVSQERFADTRSSLLGRYSASRLGFRDVLGAVRAWERLGVPIDPRKARYEKIRAATLDTVLGFHRDQVQNRPRLITVVGDKAKMDWTGIAKFGPVKECRLEDLFVD